MTENSAPSVSVEGLITLVDQIRDHVNEPRIHRALFADKERYRPACSAMDMISDTSQALRAYFQVPRGDADKATSYLVVFGALQVLYVQQDAVFWLCQSLGFPRVVARLSGPEKWIHAPGNEPLSEVRNLRNSSVGHPVKRDRGPKAERGSYFITQVSLTPDGFELLAIDEDDNTRKIPVVIPTLIDTQVHQLSATLRLALEEIDATEREHREQFKSERLKSIFSQLDYPIQKMFQAVRESSFRPVGTHHVELVQRAMQTCREKLDERGEPFDAGLELIYGRVNLALSELRAYYDRRNDNQALADVFVTFVRDRVDELLGRAREIDEDYEALPPRDTQPPPPLIVTVPVLGTIT